MIKTSDHEALSVLFSLPFIFRYEHNTDHLFAQLNIVDADDDDALRGVINWFAVHPVSMNNTNHLISSDNKGAAGIFLEREMNGRDTPLGKVQRFR